MAFSRSSSDNLMNARFASRSASLISGDTYGLVAGGGRSVLGGAIGVVGADGADATASSSLDAARLMRLLFFGINF